MLARLSSTVFGVVIVAFLLAPADPAPAAADDVAIAGDGKPLFDGKTLQGWHGVEGIDPRDLAAMDAAEREQKIAQWTAEAQKHWTVENGELVCDGEGPFLATDEEFGDFELELEYRIAPGTDSGVYLRGAPQVQIWDHTDQSKFASGADKGSGGLWNNTQGQPSRFPLVVADKPVGEWNKLRIVMVGSRTTIWLNDQLVVDHAIFENAYDAKKEHKRPVLPKGPIILQTHGGETRWRNINIKEIEPERANALLSHPPSWGAVQEEGENPFNGRDFTGWRGPVDQNRIEDGAILSSHGTIYTEDTYDDFKIHFQFQLPEKGNNGLAIRYPGEGDPAYAGMCELQVLDNAGYEGQIKPQQAHGSAYGMVAAEQGYLRPTGEWNYQEVTVQGSRIRVELNGFVILDTDLSDVKEPMVPLEKFEGRTRTSGHFGLAGHGDPVKYRNIAIKRL